MACAEFPLPRRAFLPIGLFHPDVLLANKRGRRTRAEELIELGDEIAADFEQSLRTGIKPTELARRNARWYRAIIAPVLLALIEGAHGRGSKNAAQFVLNVGNGSIVPWLPPDAVVEVPTLVEHGQLRPLVTGAVPPVVRALLQANCAYEMLAVQAIVERDRGKALQALLLNPIIHTYNQAAGVLERVWRDN